MHTEERDPCAGLLAETTYAYTLTGWASQIVDPVGAVTGYAYA